MRDFTLLTVVSTLTPASHHGNACQMTLKLPSVQMKYLALVIYTTLLFFKLNVLDAKEGLIIGVRVG